MAARNQNLSNKLSNFVNPLLFAYREAPQEATGFSPVELLYGRTVRGPVQILKELWIEESDGTEIKTTSMFYEIPVCFRIARTLEQYHEDYSRGVAKEPEEEQNAV